MTEWIKNTGGCPVEEDMLVDVVIDRIHPNFNFDTIGQPAGSWKWDIMDEDSITHWRLHEQPKTLDDALGEQNTMYKMPFEAHEAQRMIYPETTYEPLPVQPSQSALVASIFNTLYPEPCALREVHVAALKGIMKLVEERGGE